MNTKDSFERFFDFIESQELIKRFREEGMISYYDLRTVEDYDRYFFNKINALYPEFNNQLIPVMTVRFGDSVICMYQDKFYLIQIFDVVDSRYVEIDSAQEVWDKVIKKELESFFDL